MADDNRTSSVTVGPALQGSGVASHIIRIELVPHLGARIAQPCNCQAYSVWSEAKRKCGGFALPD